MLLDISKVFDKVSQQGLLYKLKQNGISGNLLETLNDFLKDRKERLALTVQNFSWANVEVGVTQGSILVHYCLSRNAELYADNTSLFSVFHYMTTSFLRLEL